MAAAETLASWLSGIRDNRDYENLISAKKDVIQTAAAKKA